MSAFSRNPKGRPKSLENKGKGKAGKPMAREGSAAGAKDTARSKPGAKPPVARKAVARPKPEVRPSRSKPTVPGKTPAARGPGAPSPAPPPLPTKVAAPAKREKKKSTGRSKAQRSAADMVAGMSLHRLSHLAATDWEDLMAMADLDGVRPYTMKGQFHRGEVIQHKVFGLGIVVLEITADKIQVSFRDGVRKLICNRQK